ncbi:hypothetical protein [Micromonospora sp. SL4-19]|uniref:hypothetical protein n=1 Tax=Micromonospora sp. SL4-19 TaxID=3399129 RepID=UPI003A4DB97C
MGTFEERIAAARAVNAAKRDAEAEARSQAANQVVAARTKALEIKPAVEEAIAAVAALPLDAPYRLTEWDWTYRRRGAVLEVQGRYAVCLMEKFKRPRFGKTGTVTPTGWSFGLHNWLTSLSVAVPKHGTSTFSVRTPVLMAPPAPEYSLDELCDLGLIRWNAGTFKDSSWEGGTMLLHKSLDTFLDVAAELVAKRRQ